MCFHICRHSVHRKKSGTAVKSPAKVRKIRSDAGKSPCEARKSPVWSYFVLDSGLAKCRLCARLIKRTGGNTSNLMAHLRSRHRDEFDEVTEESERRRSGQLVCLSDVC